MPNLVFVSSSPVVNNAIVDFPAGTVFQFESDRNPDNSGVCIRVKDTKAGKGRFVTLTGRMLTADAYDVGTPLTEGKFEVQ